jgi:hypothetical protein
VYSSPHSSVDTARELASQSAGSDEFSHYVTPPETDR